MVRSALQTRGRLNRGPRAGVTIIPAASVVALSALAILPVVADRGGWPDFGFLMLISWRLLRADAFPAWAAAGLWLFNDLVTGSPIGLSVALWPLFMLVMDVADRRTMFRDYWIEWLLASLFIGLAETAQWQVAAWSGAPVFFATMAPAMLIAILCFPVAATLVARLDRWRMGQ